jgi:hypothetical protein
MQMLAYDVVDATITVGTPTAGSFPVAIQLKNAQGGDLDHCAGVFFYLSKNSDGSTICLDGTDTTSVTIGTDGLFPEIAGYATAVCGHVISESDGDIDMTIVVLTTKTVYLVLVMPNGQLVISAIMTYTA